MAGEILQSSTTVDFLRMTKGEGRLDARRRNG